MYSQHLFEKSEAPEETRGEDEQLLQEAQKELEHLLPPPTPRQKLVLARRETSTAAELLAQELVLSLRYQLVSGPDPLNMGELDFLSLPRVRSLLIKLEVCARAEAHALILVEQGVESSMSSQSVHARLEAQAEAEAFLGAAPPSPSQPRS